MTGAAGTIGAAIAEGLAASGVSVIVGDIDQEGAQAVAERIGGESLTLDLSATKELHDLVLDVDILVNNAGAQFVAPIDQFPPDQLSRLLALMLEAPFLLSRAVLPSMYDRGWGRIVNISSIQGIRASAFKGAYVSAKHGLEGLSKVLALEGAPHGVTSNCVCPGFVQSPLVENQLADLAQFHGHDDVTSILLDRPAIKRFVSPLEVAAAVTYLCSDTAATTTGTRLVIDGGWSAS